MDLSRLKWTKNIKDESRWAYETHVMEFPDARIFALHWKPKEEVNANEPQEGDLLLLHQRARVTHLVKVLDNQVSQARQPDDWNYRVVKAVWMPPSGKDWYTLPHQKDIFGFEIFIMNGLVHNLEVPGKMAHFHERWDSQGGLTAFQQYLAGELAKIS
jgi:hypothetical protein